MKTTFTIEDRRLLASCIWIVGAALTLVASEAVVAQGGPPLITDDPETPGNGHWEINVAWTLSQKHNRRLFGIPLLDVNYGFGEHIQLKVEVPWLVLQERGARTQSGIGSANFGV